MKWLVELIMIFAAISIGLCLVLISVAAGLFIGRAMLGL